MISHRPKRTCRDESNRDTPKLELTRQREKDRQSSLTWKTFKENDVISSKEMVLVVSKATGDLIVWLLRPDLSWINVLDNFNVCEIPCYLKLSPGEPIGFCLNFHDWFLKATCSNWLGVTERTNKRDQ